MDTLTFRTMIRKIGPGRSVPRISTEDTIESTIGTILALSSRTAKYYVIVGSEVVGQMPSIHPSGWRLGSSSVPADRTERATNLHRLRKMNLKELDDEDHFKT